MALACGLMGCGQTAEIQPTGEDLYEKTEWAEDVGEHIDVEVSPIPLPEPETEAEAYDWSEEVHAVMDKMSLEEKVAQMFIVTPESFTGYSVVTAAGESTRQAYEAYPVGGFLYTSSNVDGAEQLYGMTYNTQQIVKNRIGIPAMICMNEEGGNESVIGAQSYNFDIEPVGNMCDVGATGDSYSAYKAGTSLGKYLHYYGINVDLAPVADVLSNEENYFLQYRSFGSNPQLVADMVVSEMEGLRDERVVGVLKHFPGQGATASDAHAGFASIDRSLDEMMNCDFIPFSKAIKAGADMIMVSHIACPNITGDDAPASMSSVMLQDVLRGQLKFDGVIMTDSLNSGVAMNYSSGDAAINAIVAGADMLLQPAEFQTAYQAVLDAVASGKLTEARIDESVFRIIRVKLDKLS